MTEKKVGVDVEGHPPLTLERDPITSGACYTEYECFEDGQHADTVLAGRRVIGIGPHLANHTSLENGLLIETKASKLAASSLSAQVLSRISDSGCDFFDGIVDCR
jgi:hypothetical protein